VQDLADATSVSVGRDFACALLADGNVDCWGANPNGELGNGTTQGTDIPIEVPGISNATQISAGADYACARLSSGQLKCLGDNSGAELGDGTTELDDLSPVTVAQGPISVTVAASQADTNTCSLNIDHSVTCWGQNGDGELGMALDPDQGFSAQPVRFEGLSNATTVSSGWFGECATLADGTVDCWGDDDFGELGDGQTGSLSRSAVAASGIQNGVQVTTAGQSACALLADGTVRCWGANEYGSLGNGTTTDSSTPIGVQGLS
jgi:alpha-tubulin suppressor-like RCC1 family protein